MNTETVWTRHQIERREAEEQENRRKEQWEALPSSQKVLEIHPLPWRISDTDERKATCEIVDANGVLVYFLEQRGVLEHPVCAHDLAVCFVDAMNKEPAPQN